MSEYLAPKNWEKYQPAYVSRGGKSSSWIKDYTEKESDAEYRSLTVFQRYILDGCRRICGRLGHNVPNDARFVSNQLNVSRAERGHVQSALRACTDRGLLVITNQQYNSVLSKEEKETKKKERPSRSASPASDARFSEFVLVLHRYHAKFAGTLTFAVWFGNRGGKQLKNLLKAEPGLDLKTFEQAVAVRARSPGVDHSQPVFEWLAHVLTKPRGTNGQTGKAQQRHERNDEKYRAVAAGISAGAGGNLPLGDAAGRVSPLLGGTIEIPAGGSNRGRIPPDD